MNSPLPAGADRFRPTSASDFKQYAKDLAWLIEEPLQRSQEALARIYGYSGLHELQEALKRPGEPGPFDFSRQSGDLDFDRLRARWSRTSKVVAEVKGLSAGEPVPRRLEYAVRLGLFYPPIHQRERRQFVEAELRIPEFHRQDESTIWPPKVLEHIERLYRAPWPVAPVADGSFGDRYLANGRFEGSPFDPAVMIAEARGYREPELYLRMGPKPSRHRDLPTAPDGYEDFHLHVAGEDGFAYHVVNTVYPKYGGNHLQEADEKELERLYDELDAFEREPTAAVAKSHPVLSKIPYAMRLAKAWAPHVRRLRARDHVKSRVPQVLLLDSCRLDGDPSLGRPQMSLFCMLSFSASGEHHEMRDLSIWDYHATFFRGEPGGTTPVEPVAIMTGSYIAPFGDNYHTDADQFMDMMDAKSAMLNDAWHKLQFDFFPGHGYKNVEEFCSDRPWEAFMTVDVEIAVPWRGKGLLPAFLRLFRDAVQSYPYSQQDVHWDQPGLSDEDIFEDLDEMERKYDFAFGAPRVFIFPVEGTQPERLTRSPMDIALRHANRPPVKRGRNPKIEAVREKLEKHFLGLKNKVDGDVIVYDPWDYSIT